MNRLNDEFISPGEKCHFEEFFWTKERADLISEWLRLCVSASIDSKKRLCTPDYVYRHDAENNYLISTFDNIVAEIRRKGAPFELEFGV